MASDAVSAYMAAVQLIMEGDRICGGAKVNGFGGYSCSSRSRLGSRPTWRAAATPIFVFVKGMGAGGRRAATECRWTCS